jgi:hypothetical protein
VKTVARERELGVRGAKKEVVATPAAKPASAKTATAKATTGKSVSAKPATAKKGSRK